MGDHSIGGNQRDDAIGMADGKLVAGCTPGRSKNDRNLVDPERVQKCCE
ncbi:MAG: hypothetical protein M0Q92_10040 [Methanoregula sp.]|nr:hypothetical protein [Methanoregula sp.]